MPQKYHSNARTNAHIRRLIQENTSESAKDLAYKYGVSLPTVYKWKKRTYVTDVSSRPSRIHYALSEVEQHLILSIRRSSWLPIEEITEILQCYNSSISNSSVYRCLKRNGLSSIPKIEKEKPKKFKDYKPGYIHMDVTYLPKIKGVRYYLFVAIDRATRLLFYELYTDKNSSSASLFLEKSIHFFPFKIRKILTDNGLEFSNKSLKSKKGKFCLKPSKFDIKCIYHHIEHRLIRAFYPQTNGMVERVNGIIKRYAVLKNNYTSYEYLKKELDYFLYYYNFSRKHGSLQKEQKVKTPYNSLLKWYSLYPFIFVKSPSEFEKDFIHLQNLCASGFK